MGKDLWKGVLELLDEAHKIGRKKTTLESTILEKGSYYITYDLKGRGYAEIDINDPTEALDALKDYFVLNDTRTDCRKLGISKVHQL